ncbi:MAG TPA: DUF1343 domain-containing protein, partial [Myxococcales bacterium]|nr:DUF1343 domain-containing protein [Myxococcales bacterium]
IEATNLSEGRGTTRPFEVVGAPGIDARALCDAIDSFEVDGLACRPVLFEPTFQKWGKQVCSGAVLSCVDRDALPSVRAGLAVIAAAMRVAPDVFQWRAEAYEFVDTIAAMDLLMGSDNARLVLERGGSLDEACSDFHEATRRFVQRARPHLLYLRRSGELCVPS